MSQRQSCPRWRRSGANRVGRRGAATRGAGRHESRSYVTVLTLLQSEAPLSRAPSTRTPALKFAVAAPPPTQPAAHVQEGSEPHSRRPSSPFARERQLQRELDLDAEMEPNGDRDGEGDEDDECAEASEESPDARLPGYRGSSNDDGRN